MKRFFIAAALAATSAGAFAGDTATVLVKASVTPTCKFATASGTLDFGTLDPSATALPTMPTLGLAINCTKNTNLTSIVLQPAAGSTGTATTGTGLTGGTYNGSMTTTGGTLPFSITWPTTTATNNGFPGSTTSNLTLTGGLTLANVQVAVAGSYTSTVQVVIQP